MCRTAEAQRKQSVAKLSWGMAVNCMAANSSGKVERSAVPRGKSKARAQHGQQCYAMAKPGDGLRCAAKAMLRADWHSEGKAKRRVATAQR